MLFQPNLAKAVGSSYVAQRIQELRPLAHVFGHTHFLWDTTIKKVRYVQWCLGTPKEQRCRPPPPGGPGLGVLNGDRLMGLELIFMHPEHGLAGHQARNHKSC